MNQHEKDWLDLGRQLKDYQPEGQPEEDFLSFQQLQLEKKPRRFALWVLWWLLPAFVLVLSTTLYWQGTVPDSTGVTTPLAIKATEARTDDVRANDLDVATINVNTRVAEVRPEAPVPTSIDLEEKVTPKRKASARTLRQSPGDEHKDIPQFTPEPKQDKLAPALAVDQHNPVQFSSTLLPDKDTDVEKRASEPPAKPEVLTELLTVRPIDKLTIVDEGLELDIRKGKARPRLTLGAGLSNHWRGDNFLQDVDRGLYINLGLYQPVGQRFGLEAQLGYRTHDLNVPVLTNAKEPWSYHKDEIHNTGHMGEVRVYIYEGTVESYQAVEFSLLARYQLRPRLGLHAGARYALPSIKFKRQVHGPDDENPFHDFIEQQEMVKSRDYGGIFGLNYRLTSQLSLQGEVHLGLVDLIENAAQEGERFNRSNSLSVGVRYSFD